MRTNFKIVSLMQNHDLRKTFTKRVKMTLKIAAHRKLVQQNQVKTWEMTPLKRRNRVHSTHGSFEDAHTHPSPPALQATKSFLVFPTATNTLSEPEQAGGGPGTTQPTGIVQAPLLLRRPNGAISEGKGSHLHNTHPPRCCLT